MTMTMTMTMATTMTTMTMIHDDHVHDDGHEGHDDHDEHDMHAGHDHLSPEEIMDDPAGCPTDSVIQMYHMEEGTMF